MRPFIRALAALPVIHQYHAWSHPEPARSASARDSGGGGGGSWFKSGGKDRASGGDRGGSGTTTIGYVTDIEGNKEFFDEYVRISRVLERRAGAIHLRDGCEFVFGGDVCDKGDGDLYVIRELVSLKERYPDRVHLILGNRDVNKIRWAHELDAPGAKKYRGAPTGKCVSWWADAQAPDASRADRMRWMLHHTMGSAETFELRRQELTRERGPAGAKRAPAGPTDEEVVDSFLQSVDACGAMREFIKLGQIGAVLGDCLFVHGAVSEGCMGKVPPACGTVPARDKSGGHFTDAPGGLVGWIAALNAFAAAEVTSWLAFPKGDPACARPWAEEGGYGGRGGEGLVQYGMGAIPAEPERAAETGKRVSKTLYNPTVIYATWFDHGQPAFPPKRVVDYIREAGVTTVLTGHQPIGDTPVVMLAGAPGGRAGDARANDLVIVAADTSYSNNVRWLDVPGGPPARGPASLDPDKLPAVHTKPDGKPSQVRPGGGNRGVCVLEVVAEMDNRVRFSRDTTVAPRASGPVQPTRVSVHGVLSDGRSYAYTLPVRPTPGAAPNSPGAGVDPFVGRVLDGGWLVRAPVAGPVPGSSTAGDPDAPGGGAGGREYVVTRGQGFNMFNLQVPEATLKAWVAAEEAAGQKG